MPRSRLPVPLLALLGILGSLALLAWLPSFFSERRYALAPKTVALSHPFPLDTALNIVAERPKGSALQTTTLRKLLATSKGGLLINFWATWCPPCIEEFPTLEYLQRELSKSSDRSLPKLVTISVDETFEVVFALFKSLDFKPSFPVLQDKDATLARLVGTTKFPETYWIDADGQLIYKWVGPQNWLSEDVLLRFSRPKAPKVP